LPDLTPEFAPAGGVSRCVGAFRRIGARGGLAGGIVVTSSLTSLRSVTMIQQIISHTPIYVWALLAFLLYRGYLASQDRATSLRKVAMIPLVMLALALSSMNTHGALGDAVWLVWGVGAVAATALVWHFSSSEIHVDRAAGTLFQRGSWLPMLTMIAIFVTKYAVAVLSAMHPQLAFSLPFASTIALLFGLFNGLFLGRLARYCAAYLRQPAQVAIL
jgi:hypothetical protein